MGRPLAWRMGLAFHAQAQPDHAFVSSTGSATERAEWPRGTVYSHSASLRATVCFQGLARQIFMIFWLIIKLEMNDWRFLTKGETCESCLLPYEYTNVNNIY